MALDELPDGDFVEIEGPDVAMLRAASQRLGLKWEAAVPESYVALFDRLRMVQGLTFRDLAFENFQGEQLANKEHPNVELLKDTTCRLILLIPDRGVSLWKLNISD